MKRIFVALALALALASPLGACAQLTKTIEAINGYAVTQNQIDAARSTYDGSVLVPLAKYASFPRCARGTSIGLTNLCHDGPLLKRLRDADRVVAKAFDETQDMVTSGNNQGAVAAYGTLKAAIAAAQALITTARVPGV